MVALNDYGKKFHSIETFFTRTGATKRAVEEQKKSFSTISNKLPVKEELTVREGLRVTFAPSHINPDSQLTVEKPTITVEFFIHKTLLDPKPTIVQRESKTLIWLAVLL